MKIKKYIALLLASLLVISTTVPSFITAKVVADEKTSITSEYTIDEQRQIDEVAAVLEKMFADGVTEENLKQYAQANYSEEELIIADNELNTNLSQIQDENAIMYKVAWGALGNCMANKIKDELLAMISVGTIIKYAQKKAWKELAKIVIKYVAKAGVKTNAALIAGQLAIWGLQCGINF